MVSVHSSELVPLGWDAVTKRHLFLQKVSSKLGPGVRQQGGGTRAEKGPSAPGSGTGPPKQGSPGFRQAQRDDSMLGEVWQSAGGGSPARHSQIQSQGIPKPRTAAERASVSAVTSPSSCNSKPTANQLAASARRPIPPASSKLPVKGLSTSLSSSSLGHEISGATSKASPAAPAPTVIMPEEQPSRSTLPVGTQSPAKPLPPSPAASTSTSTASEALISGAPKTPASRGRAQSVQARTTATGLKVPTVINHNTAKAAAANQTAAKTAPAANQSLTKQTSQNHLQRSGSARLSRLNSIASCLSSDELAT
ncbi:hypothetical protein OYC64_017373 [Pagothenia borchgrevinki]|uniref:Uncharacterized protein n=1 Tax=Pagothenia borchgrevinki TaxID=8213 RepID=A0ABD2HNY4_PAGBO